MSGSNPGDLGEPARDKWPGDAENQGLYGRRYCRCETDTVGFPRKGFIVAYIPVKERKRRAELEKRPFISEYFNLKYDAKGAFGNPEFPWILVLSGRGGSKIYKSGHKTKWSAQQSATEKDKFINDFLRHFGYSTEFEVHKRIQVAKDSKSK